MRAEPILNDYSVGIVIPKAGINGAQLAVISDRLGAILKLLPEHGWLNVYVPGFDMADAEASIARELRNVLERKGQRLRLTYIPTRGDHKAGVAHHIVYELGTAKGCDEIWCCPAPGQTAQSMARVAQVYRLGQAGRAPARYKQIPPWVEPPASQQTNQPKKGKKSWRDMFNKASFHW